MIKVFICDGNGTLEFPNPSEESIKLVNFIHASEIILAVVTNSQNRAAVVKKFKDAGMKEPEVIVTRDDLGVSKPSPKFIDEVLRQTGAEKTELIYLGDDERTDSFCAINAKILPLVAQYGENETENKYGLPVYSPKSIVDYLRTYGIQKSPFFGWTCTYKSPYGGGDLDIRAMLYDHSNITGKLKRVLKQHSDLPIGSTHVQFKAILFHLLVSKCFQSGLIEEVDTITVYPGHRRKYINPTLSGFADMLAKISKKKSVHSDLIIRHKEAPKSQYQGSNRNIHDQFRTIMINPDNKKFVEGKRILVFDDFTTNGYSLETSRRMLDKAGASKVTCIAFAKYGIRHSITKIKENWDPFEPCNLKEEDIIPMSVSGDIHDESDKLFHETILPYYSR